MAQITVAATVMTCVRNGYSTAPSPGCGVGGQGPSPNYNNSVYMTFPSFGLRAGCTINGASMNFAMTSFDWDDAVTMNLQACASAGSCANQVGCTGSPDGTSVPQDALTSWYNATNTARQMYSAGTYFLKMFCANGTNRKHYTSTPATLVIDYTEPTPPGKATGLSISENTYKDGVTFRWLSSAPGVNNPCINYDVYYRLNSGSPTLLGNTGNTSAWLDTTAFPQGTRLDFYVNARSNYADPVTSDYPGQAIKNSAPNVPTGVSLAKSVYVPGEPVRVSFTNPGDPDGNLQGYKAKTSANGTIYPSTAGATYVDVDTTGWTPGISYTFNVCACDTFGICSGWSPSVSALVGLPMRTAPTEGVLFKQAAQMKVFVMAGDVAKTVKSMKVAVTQGSDFKTVF